MTMQQTNTHQNYPTQGYANQQQAAAGLQSLNEVKAIPVLEAHVNRISGGAQDLEALAIRLQTVADRVFGAQAQATGKDSQPAPSPSHSIGRLADAHEWNDRALMMLRYAVERLEAL
jgi:hypothetical protein